MKDLKKTIAITILIITMSLPIIPLYVHIGFWSFFLWYGIGVFVASIVWAIKYLFFKF